MEGASPGLLLEEARLSTELELGEWVTVAMELMLTRDLNIEAVGRLPIDSLFLLSSKAACTNRKTIGDSLCKVHVHVIGFLTLLQ